jgi:hypothetical protein
LIDKTTPIPAQSCKNDNHVFNLERVLEMMKKEKISRCFSSKINSSIATTGKTQAFF